MIKKIRVKDLEVGMFIEDFNVPWVDHPFLANKKLIKSVKEIRTLEDRAIREVYIDTQKGRDSTRALSVDEAEAAVREEMSRDVLDAPEPEAGEDTPEEATPFNEELRRARGIHARAKALVQGLFHDARMGKSIDGERTARIVDEMVDSIFRNRDALASLSRLKSFDDYTFQHSVNVSVLSLALGRHLGILKGELKRLGIGAILHDVGKMAIPEEVLRKPGGLSDEEFALMKTHTLRGAKILLQAADVPEDCAAVALNHHERFNGGGYPRAIQGLGIGKFGLISAVADVYDAITSDRVYHKGISSYQAVQKIYERAKIDFYPIYVQKFIQCMGIYPIGSVVRLDTGDVGVVCRQNPGQLLRPRVRLVRQETGQPISPILEVDLLESDRAGRRPFSRSIAEVLEPFSAEVDVAATLLSTASRTVG